MSEGKSYLDRYIEEADSALKRLVEKVETLERTQAIQDKDIDSLRDVAAEFRMDLDQLKAWRSRTSPLLDQYMESRRLGREGWHRVFFSVVSWICTALLAALAAAWAAQNLVSK